MGPVFRRSELGEPARVWAASRLQREMNRALDGSCPIVGATVTRQDGDDT